MAKHSDPKRKASSRPGGLRLPGFTLATPQQKKQCYGLLALVLVIYLTTFSSVPISTLDDQLMLTSAMSFAKTGKFTAPTRFATKRFGSLSFGQEAVTGEVYSKYSFGYPLVLAMAVLLARPVGLLLGGAGAEIILCFPSILALAATALLVWRTALRLGFSAVTAHCLVSGLALGSFAWPHAGINFSEPFQMLCVAGAFYALLAAWQEEEHWKSYALLGGIALGYAIVIKASLGAVAPILVLGALGGWYRKGPFRTAAVRTALFALPGLVASSYLIASNFFLFGDPKNFGYGSETFSSALSAGIRQVIVGFDRGILWYAPLVVLAPWGFYKLLRGNNKWPPLVLGGASVVYCVLIALWHGPGGGHCWGPRLLMPILPFLVLLAGGALDTPAKRRIGWLLVAIGLGINSLGALVYYQSYYTILRSAKRDWSPRESVFNPILCHFWLARVQADALVSGKVESESGLWRQPPWIRRYPEAIPPAYSLPGQPILNPWPLRRLLPESRWRREETWYLRALLEVAIMKYEQKDLPGATEIIDEGLGVDPDYKQLLAAKGMVFQTSRDTRRALYYFDRSLEVDPDYELGLYGRGLTMEALGDYTAARAAYTRLLGLPSGTLNREEVEERLRRLPGK